MNNREKATRERVRYNDNTFMDADGNELYFFDVKPRFAWRHLGRLTSSMRNAHGAAWAAYKTACPYGPCEAPVVAKLLRSVKGLSIVAAQYVADRVYPFRDKHKDVFSKWMAENYPKEET